MQFVPLNLLEESLVKASSDPAHRPQFYKDLTNEDIFIMQECSSNTQSGKTTLEEGTQLKIQNIEWEGRPYIPVFSSLERLQSVIEHEVDYVALNFLEFMKITKGADLLLNPGLDYGKAFTAPEIESLIDGSIWEPSETFVAKKDTQIMLGEPSNYPSELVEILAKFFKKHRSVKKAYLAHFFNPDDGEKPHTLIAIEVDGDPSSIMAEAGVVANNSVVPDPPIDFITLTGEAGIEDYFKSSKPFYQKKILGIF